MLFPAERLVFLILLLTTTLYLVFGVPLREPLHLYWAQLQTVLYLYPFGLMVCLIWTFGKDGLMRKREGLKPSEKEAWATFRQQFLSLRDIFEDLRLLNVLMLLFVAFAFLKNLIPVINPAIYDQAFLDIEHWLFSGMLAFEVLDTFIPRSAAWIISGVYEAFYVYVSFITLLFVFQRNRSLSHEFCYSFILLWTVGVFWVYLIPTLGPCFFTPEIFTELYGTLGNTPHPMAEMQKNLWAMKGELFAISGFPSLHLAFTLLGSWYLHRIWAPLAWLSWVFAAGTFIATLYFGWHYLLDDLGSVLLVASVIPLGRKFAYPTGGSGSQ